MAGKNAFALEFTSAKDAHAGRRGKGDAQHEHGHVGYGADDRGRERLARQDPGRYLGTIEFPDSGARQVTVSWDGPAWQGLDEVFCVGALTRAPCTRAVGPILRAAWWSRRCPRDAAALTAMDEVTVDELVTRALADNPDVRAEASRRGGGRGPTPAGPACGPHLLDLAVRRR